MVINELENLWPSLGELENISITPPVAILRQQADAIGEITNNVIEGQVTSEKVMVIAEVPITSIEEIRKLVQPRLFPEKPRMIEDNSRLRYSFFLRPVVLGDYKVGLCQITHDLARLYPVTFAPLIRIDKEQFSRNQATDENELRKLLREFFHSDAVKAVLSSLLAQSR